VPIISSKGGLSSSGYGQFAYAANLAPTNSYFPIASYTVPATAQASIIFAGIPQTFSHLQIRMMAIYTGTVGSGFIAFNGDNASGNYSYHQLLADGSTTGSGGLASQNQGKFTGGAGTSPAAPNVMVMDILDYANTNKYKTTRALYSWDSNGSGYVEFNSNNWRSTSAITSIVLTPANSFAQYTNISIYGVN
jgi:hypothetical protein